MIDGSVPAENEQPFLGDVTGSLRPSLHLIEACGARAVGQLIFASSGETIYGPTSARPIPKTTATNPITTDGINKLAVEKYLSPFRYLHRLDLFAFVSPTRTDPISTAPASMAWWKPQSSMLSAAIQ